MPELWIPDDWPGEEWECHLIDWPKSEQWRAILRGFMSTAARGRFWAPQSGSIKDAQIVGREIIARNGIDMSCEDITTQLEAIVTALGAIDVNIVNQVQATADNTNSIDIQTEAIAISNATASSVASAYANATLIQKVIIDLRPLGGDLEDPSEQEAEEGGISTTGITDDPRCAAAYWITYAARAFFTWLLNNYIPFWFETSTSALAALGAALKIAAWKVTGPGTPILLGAASLTALVEYIVYLEKNELAEPVLEDIVGWLTDDFDLIRCKMYVDGGLLDTEGVQSSLVNEATIYGVQVAATILIQNFFNLNTLALLLFDSPFIDIPDIPQGIDCTGCQGV